MRGIAHFPISLAAAISASLRFRYNSKCLIVRKFHPAIGRQRLLGTYDDQPALPILCRMAANDRAALRRSAV
jgi:hypothetical protein